MFDLFTHRLLSPSLSLSLVVFAGPFLDVLGFITHVLGLLSAIVEGKQISSMRETNNHSTLAPSCPAPHFLDPKP